MDHQEEKPEARELRPCRASRAASRAASLASWVTSLAACTAVPMTRSATSSISFRGSWPGERGAGGSPEPGPGLTLALGTGGGRDVARAGALNAGLPAMGVSSWEVSAAWASSTCSNEDMLSRRESMQSSGCEWGSQGDGALPRRPPDRCSR